MNQQDKRSIDTLLGIMAALRDPERGCPWDREQDFGSIAPYTIEEAYEVADAIDRDDLPSCATSLATCSFRWCFTHRWPARSALSILPMSCRPSAKRCCGVIRMFSARSRSDGRRSARCLGKPQGCRACGPAVTARPLRVSGRRCRRSAGPASSASVPRGSALTGRKSMA